MRSWRFFFLLKIISGWWIFVDLSYTYRWENYFRFLKTDAIYQLYDDSIYFLQVVTALGKTYHQKCFTCARCRQPFPSGEKVTYTGKEVLCPKCVQIPVRDATPKTSPTTNSANGKLKVKHHAPNNMFTCFAQVLSDSSLTFIC